MRVTVDVQDYGSAILQVAQASLRSIIGKSDLDDLLSNRERLNQGLELMIDNPGSAGCSPTVVSRTRPVRSPAPLAGWSARRPAVG